MEWSSSRTLERTHANGARLGYQARMLETWYDLDEWKDIERLTAELRRGRSLPPRLAAFLEELRKEKGGMAS